MPLSSFELQQVSSLHGGDTGSIPVRDAKFVSAPKQAQYAPVYAP
jgi:hypothetical protein